MQVRKRDGTLEDLNIDKLHKVVMYACEGIPGVSASQVEINSKIQFFDKIDTEDIQETLIKSAADLISEEAPNYQYVAGRLINYHLRKMVYGQFEPPCLCDIVQENIDAGFYDPEFTELYTKDEINQLQSFIDHERDEVLIFSNGPSLKATTARLYNGNEYKIKITILILYLRYSFFLPAYICSIIYNIY